ncbi:uncharacterized protein LOC129855516 isoform X1 [Salvelinus fontinalis]|uniref:uncharacterized protein LOC129855516 isoform X1 n=1 Tax=Salvelinus fontinalis TaxID=8038 RepID=UPI0024865748|nr:uncharacterized protein LOC129855516 isoform X1 [Salvelinus fontinalis]
MKIGLWAIEEMRRALPYRKPDTMGVVTGAPTDTKEGGPNNNDGPPTTTATPSAPTHLYPELPQGEKKAPPPYFQNPFTHLPQNPFLTPAVVQAPVFVVHEGHLKGSMTLGIQEGQLLCEERPDHRDREERDRAYTQGRGGGSNSASLQGHGESLSTYPQGRGVGSQLGPLKREDRELIQFSSTPNPDWFRNRTRGESQIVTEGSWSPPGHCPSGAFLRGNHSKDDEGGNRTGQDEEEEERDLRESLARARSMIDDAECGEGSYHIKGVMMGKVTDLVEPIRQSVRLKEQNRRGVSSRADWDPKHGGREGSEMQMPLRPTPDGGHEEYQPWKITDLTTLMGQLPSLHGGASAWLLQLQTLTSGLRLCLGDIRALLARATDHTTMSALIREADLATAPAALAQEDFRAELWAVLRRAYPTERNHATLSSFTINPGEQPAAYLDRAKTTWRTVHEEPYDHTGTTISMWKEMVVSGAPIEVRTKLRATVGLMALPQAQFNSHVHHHITQYNKDKGGAETQVQSLQVQLLKLQLKEAQKGEKPKKQMVAEDQPDISQIIEKTVSQMIQQQQPPRSTPQGPIIPSQLLDQPLPMVTPPYYQPTQQGYPSTWGQQPRYPSPWGTGQTRPINCYNCKQIGHMARQCPHPLTPTQHYWMANRALQTAPRGRGGVRPMMYQPRAAQQPAYNHPIPDPNQQPPPPFQGMSDEYAPWP